VTCCQGGQDAVSGDHPLGGFHCINCLTWRKCSHGLTLTFLEYVLPFGLRVEQGNPGLQGCYREVAPPS
jgi:hypothetical protein